MPFIGSVEGTFGYGRGGSEPPNSNRLFVEGATYIPTTNNRQIDITGSVTDTLNNIYVTGTYTSNSEITLKNMSGQSQSDSTWKLPITTVNKTFLIKYSQDGIVLWAIYFSDTGNNTGKQLNLTGISIDSSNNLYWVGPYTGASNIFLKQISVGGAIEDSQYYLPASSGTRNGFIVKLNSSGQVIWSTFVRAQTGGTARFAECRYVKIVNNLLFVGGVYSTDSSINVANIGDVSGFTGTNGRSLLSTSVSTTNGSYAMFLASLSLNGISARATINRTTTTDTPELFNISGIVTDGTYIYMLGYYSRSNSLFLLFRATVNTQETTTYSLPKTYDTPQTLVTQPCLIKYNTLLEPLGSAYIKPYTGSSTMLSFGIGINNTDIYITTDNVGTIYNASGLTQAQSTIGLLSVTNYSNTLIKFNSALVCQWATILPISARSIFTDTNNTIYLGGQFLFNPSVGTPIYFYNASGTSQVLSRYPSMNIISGFLRFIGILKYNSNGKMMVGTFIQYDPVNSTGNKVGSINRVGSYIYVMGGYSYSLNTTVGTLYNGFGNNQKITDPAYTLPCPWAVFSTTATTNQSGLIVRYSVVE